MAAGAQGKEEGKGHGGIFFFWGGGCKSVFQQHRGAIWEIELLVGIFVIT